MRTSLLTSVVAAALVLGCGGARDGEIAIGMAGPFHEGYGEMNRLGAELAVKELNAAGGLRGRRVRLVAQNDSANPMVAARVAEAFVDDPSVLAVVGHVNSGTTVMAAKVYDGRLPAVATTASSPDITGISPWVFRTIVSDSANALDMARYASKAGFRRAAIAYENDSYGRALATLFRAAFEGQVVSMDPIPADGVDVEPWISYYHLRQPDLVFVAGTETSGLAMLREARRQRVAADFMGADGWVGILTDTAASEGAIVFSPFTPADPDTAVQRFVDAFRKEYQREPDANAALAYDATVLIGRAIARGGADRQAIRDWIAALDARTAVRGVTGPLHFLRGDRQGRGFLSTRVRRGVLAVEDRR